jgi:uncharacterized protein YraI
MLLLVAAAVVVAQREDARVNPMANNLNLRTGPSVTSEIVAELPGETPLTVLGRTGNNRWLQVRTANGLEGWVAEDFVQLYIPLADIPVVGGAVEPADAPAADPVESAPSGDSAPAPAASDADARVVEMAATLNMREAPSLQGAIITELESGTPLNILETSEDGRWLRVQAGSFEGWVFGRYVQRGVGAVPSGGTDGGSDGARPASPVSGSLSGAREIFLRGQELGNRANVFSKVGDSITTSSWTYTPIASDNIDLGQFGYLQDVIDFYRGATARTNNSFVNRSLASWASWTSADVLNPELANDTLCEPGESPLECEYRLVQPAVAMIMLGTNDLAAMDVNTFRANMTEIAEISEEMGVIPVFGTIPLRGGFNSEVRQFNAAVESIASARNLPVWDYNAAVSGLPNAGLSDDFIHPSAPPRDNIGGVNFANDDLDYGYPAFNLSVLQTLDRILNGVIR